MSIEKAFIEEELSKVMMTDPKKSRVSKAGSETAIFKALSREGLYANKVKMLQAKSDLDLEVPQAREWRRRPVHEKLLSL